MSSLIAQLPDNVTLVVLGIILVIILALLAIIGMFFKIWLRAKVSGAPVSFGRTSR